MAFEDHSPMRNALGIAGGLVTLLVGILTLKEMAEKDRHVQQFFAWVANLVNSRPFSVANVHWVGFGRGFSESTPSGWYSWLLFALVVAGIVLLILLAWTVVLDGFDGDAFAASGGAAFGVVVALAATKGAWLLLVQATLLTIIGGVGLAVFAVVVVLGAAVGVLDAI